MIEQFCDGVGDGCFGDMSGTKTEIPLLVRTENIHEREDEGCAFGAYGKPMSNTHRLRNDSERERACVCVCVRKRDSC